MLIILPNSKEATLINHSRQLLFDLAWKLPYPGMNIIQLFVLFFYTVTSFPTNLYNKPTQSSSSARILNKLLLRSVSLWNFVL